MSENPFFSAFFEGFRPARQRERAALTIYRALEARQADHMPVGGVSADSRTPPPRTPRTQRRTSARKPASGDDGDGDGPAPRYSIGATAHEGLTVQTADGQHARLCVVDDDGNVLSDDVCAEVFKVAVASYRQFLQGTGHLRVHSGPPSGLKT